MIVKLASYVDAAKAELRHLAAMQIGGGALTGGAIGALGGAIGAPKGERMKGALKGGAVGGVAGAGLGAGGHYLGTKEVRRQLAVAAERLQ